MSLRTRVRGVGSTSETMYGRSPGTTAVFDQIAGLSEVERPRTREEAVSTSRNNEISHQLAANVDACSLSVLLPAARLTTYVTLLPNMFIVVLFVCSIYPALARWRSIPYPIWSILYFSSVAFGGMSLLSAFERHFRPLIPIWALWLSFVYLRVLRIEIRSEHEITGQEPHVGGLRYIVAFH
jgi:hypothetical protein